VGNTGPLLYNPAAFALPTGLTFGDTGRNFLRNPSRTNFDLALFKHFAIKESFALELRGEAFNVFNHTQWAPISGNSGGIGANFSSSTNSFDCASAGNPRGLGGGTCLTTSDFLNVGAAHNPRILQLGLKFLF
jgi:hypothetical protein